MSSSLSSSTSPQTYVESESFPYRLPVFKLEGQKVAYNSSLTKDASTVRIVGCDFPTNYYNVSFNNNTLRWIRKVQLDLNETVIENFPDNINAVNPFFDGNAPAEEYHLCQLYIAPNQYESVDDILYEVNYRLNESVKSIFQFNSETVRSYEKVGINYDYDIYNSGGIIKLTNTSISDAAITSSSSKEVSYIVSGEAAYTSLTDNTTKYITNAILRMSSATDCIITGATVLNPKFEADQFSQYEDDDGWHVYQSNLNALSHEGKINVLREFNLLKTTTNACVYTNVDGTIHTGNVWNVDGTINEDFWNRSFPSTYIGAVEKANYWNPITLNGEMITINKITLKSFPDHIGLSVDENRRSFSSTDYIYTPSLNADLGFGINATVDVTPVDENTSEVYGTITSGNIRAFSVNCNVDGGTTKNVSMIDYSGDLLTDSLYPTLKIYYNDNFKDSDNYPYYNISESTDEMVTKDYLLEKFADTSSTDISPAYDWIMTCDTPNENLTVSFAMSDADILDDSGNVKTIDYSYNIASGSLDSFMVNSTSMASPELVGYKLKKIVDTNGEEVTQTFESNDTFVNSLTTPSISYDKVAITQNTSEIITDNQTNLIIELASNTTLTDSYEFTSREFNVDGTYNIDGIYYSDGTLEMSCYTFNTELSLTSTPTITSGSFVKALTTDDKDGIYNMISVNSLNEVSRSTTTYQISYNSANVTAKMIVISNSVATSLTISTENIIDCDANGNTEMDYYKVNNELVAIPSGTTITDEYKYYSDGTQTTSYKRLSIAASGSTYTNVLIFETINGSTLGTSSSISLETISRARSGYLYETYNNQSPVFTPLNTLNFAYNDVYYTKIDNMLYLPYGTFDSLGTLNYKTSVNAGSSTMDTTYIFNDIVDENLSLTLTNTAIGANTTTSTTTIADYTTWNTTTSSVPGVSEYFVKDTDTGEYIEIVSININDNSSSTGVNSSDIFDNGVSKYYTNAVGYSTVSDSAYDSTLGYYYNVGTSSNPVYVYVAADNLYTKEIVTSMSDNGTFVKLSGDNGIWTTETINGNVITVPLYSDTFNGTTQGENISNFSSGTHTTTYEEFVKYNNWRKYKYFESISDSVITNGSSYLLNGTDTTVESDFELITTSNRYNRNIDLEKYIEDSDAVSSTVLLKDIPMTFSQTIASSVSTVSVEHNDGIYKISNTACIIKTINGYIVEPVGESLTFTRYTSAYGVSGGNDLVKVYAYGTTNEISLTADSVTISKDSDGIFTYNSQQISIKRIIYVDSNDSVNESPTFTDESSITEISTEISPVDYTTITLTKYTNAFSYESHPMVTYELNNISAFMYNGEFIHFYNESDERCYPVVTSDGPYSFTKVTGEEYLYACTATTFNGNQYKIRLASTDELLTIYSLQIYRQTPYMNAVTANRYVQSETYVSDDSKSGNSLMYFYGNVNGTFVKFDRNTYLQRHINGTSNDFSDRDSVWVLYSGTFEGIPIDTYEGEYTSEYFIVLPDMLVYSGSSMISAEYLRKESNSWYIEDSDSVCSYVIYNGNITYSSEFSYTTFVNTIGDGTFNISYTTLGYTISGTLIKLTSEQLRIASEAIEIINTESEKNSNNVTLYENGEGKFMTRESNPSEYVVNYTLKDSANENASGRFYYNIDGDSKVYYTEEPTKYYLSDSTNYANTTTYKVSINDTYIDISSDIPVYVLRDTNGHLLFTSNGTLNDNFNGTTLTESIYIVVDGTYIEITPETQLYGERLEATHYSSSKDGEKISLENSTDSPEDISLMKYFWVSVDGDYSECTILNINGTEYDTAYMSDVFVVNESSATITKTTKDSSTYSSGNTYNVLVNNTFYEYQYVLPSTCSYKFLSTDRVNGNMYIKLNGVLVDGAGKTFSLDEYTTTNSQEYSMIQQVISDNGINYYVANNSTKYTKGVSVTSLSSTISDVDSENNGLLCIPAMNPSQSSGKYVYGYTLTNKSTNTCDGEGNTEMTYINYPNDLTKMYYSNGVATTIPNSRHKCIMNDSIKANSFASNDEYYRVIFSDGTHMRLTNDDFKYNSYGYTDEQHVGIFTFNATPISYVYGESSSDLFWVKTSYGTSQMFISESLGASQTHVYTVPSAASITHNFSEFTIESTVDDVSLKFTATDPVTESESNSYNIANETSESTYKISVENSSLNIYDESYVKHVESSLANTFVDNDKVYTFETYNNNSVDISANDFSNDNGDIYFIDALTNTLLVDFSELYGDILNVFDWDDIAEMTYSSINGELYQYACGSFNYTFKIPSGCSVGDTIKVTTARGFPTIQQTITSTTILTGSIYYRSSSYSLTYVDSDSNVAISNNTVINTGLDISSFDLTSVASANKIVIKSSMGYFNVEDIGTTLTFSSNSNEIVGSTYSIEYYFEDSATTTSTDVDTGDTKTDITVEITIPEPSEIIAYYYYGMDAVNVYQNKSLISPSTTTVNSTVYEYSENPVSSTVIDSTGDSLLTTQKNILNMFAKEYSTDYSYGYSSTYKPYENTLTTTISKYSTISVALSSTESILINTSATTFEDTVKLFSNGYVQPSSNTISDGTFETVANNCVNDSETYIAIDSENVTACDYFCDVDMCWFKDPVNEDYYYCGNGTPDKYYSNTSKHRYTVTEVSPLYSTKVNYYDGYQKLIINTLDGSATGFVNGDSYDISNVLTYSSASNYSVYTISGEKLTPTLGDTLTCLFDGTFELSSNGSTQTVKLSKSSTVYSIVHSIDGIDVVVNILENSSGELLPYLSSTGTLTCTINDYIMVYDMDSSTTIGYELSYPATTSTFVTDDNNYYVNEYFGYSIANTRYGISYSTTQQSSSTEYFKGSDGEYYLYNAIDSPYYQELTTTPTVTAYKAQSYSTTGSSEVLYATSSTASAPAFRSGTSSTTVSKVFPLDNLEEPIEGSLTITATGNYYNIVIADLLWIPNESLTLTYTNSSWYARTNSMSESIRVYSFTALNGTTLIPSSGLTETTLTYDNELNSFKGTSTLFPTVTDADNINLVVRCIIEEPVSEVSYDSVNKYYTSPSFAGALMVYVDGFFSDFSDGEVVGLAWGVIDDKFIIVFDGSSTTHENTIETSKYVLESSIVERRRDTFYRSNSDIPLAFFVNDSAINITDHYSRVYTSSSADVYSWYTTYNSLTENSDEIPNYYYVSDTVRDYLKEAWELSSIYETYSRDGHAMYHPQENDINSVKAVESEWFKKSLTYTLNNTSGTYFKVPADEFKELSFEISVNGYISNAYGKLYDGTLDNLLTESSTIIAENSYLFIPFVNLSPTSEKDYINSPPDGVNYYYIVEFDKDSVNNGTYAFTVEDFKYFINDDRYMEVIEYTSNNSGSYVGIGNSYVLINNNTYNLTSLIGFIEDPTTDEPYIKHSSYNLFLPVYDEIDNGISELDDYGWYEYVIQYTKDSNGTYIKVSSTIDSSGYVLRPTDSSFGPLVKDLDFALASTSAAVDLDAFAKYIYINGPVNGITSAAIVCSVDSSTNEVEETSSTTTAGYYFGTIYYRTVSEKNTYVYTAIENQFVATLKVSGTSSVSGIPYTFSTNALIETSYTIDQLFVGASEISLTATTEDIPPYILNGVSIDDRLMFRVDGLPCDKSLKTPSNRALTVLKYIDETFTDNPSLLSFMVPCEFYDEKIPYNGSYINVMKLMKEGVYNVPTYQEDSFMNIDNELTTTDIFIDIDNTLTSTGPSTNGLSLLDYNLVTKRANGLSLYPTETIDGSVYSIFSGTNTAGEKNYIYAPTSADFDDNICKNVEYVDIGLSTTETLSDYKKTYYSKDTNGIVNETQGLSATALTVNNAFEYRYDSTSCNDFDEKCMYLHDSSNTKRIPTHSDRGYFYDISDVSFSNDDINGVNYNYNTFVIGTNWRYTENLSSKTYTYTLANTVDEPADGYNSNGLTISIPLYSIVFDKIFYKDDINECSIEILNDGSQWIFSMISTDGYTYMRTYPGSLNVVSSSGTYNIEAYIYNTIGNVDDSADKIDSATHSETIPETYYYPYQEYFYTYTSTGVIDVSSTTNFICRATYIMKTSDVIAEYNLGSSSKNISSRPFCRVDVKYQQFYSKNGTYNVNSDATQGGYSIVQNVDVKTLSMDNISGFTITIIPLASSSVPTTVPITIDSTNLYYDSTLSIAYDCGHYYKYNSQAIDIYDSANNLIVTTPDGDISKGSVDDLYRKGYRIDYATGRYTQLDGTYTHGGSSNDSFTQYIGVVPEGFNYYVYAQLNKFIPEASLTDFSTVVSNTDDAQYTKRYTKTISVNNISTTSEFDISNYSFMLIPITGSSGVSITNNSYETFVVSDDNSGNSSDACNNEYLNDSLQSITQHCNIETTFTVDTAETFNYIPLTSIDGTSVDSSVIPVNGFSIVKTAGEITSNIANITTNETLLTAYDNFIENSGIANVEGDYTVNITLSKDYIYKCSSINASTQYFAISNYTGAESPVITTVDNNLVYVNGVYYTSLESISIMFENRSYTITMMSVSVTITVSDETSTYISVSGVSSDVTEIASGITVNVTSDKTTIDGTDIVLSNDYKEVTYSRDSSASYWKNTSNGDIYSISVDGTTYVRPLAETYENLVINNSRISLTVGSNEILYGQAFVIHSLITDKDVTVSDISYGTHSLEFVSAKFKVVSDEESTENTTESPIDLSDCTPLTTYVMSFVNASDSATYNGTQICNTIDGIYSRLSVNSSSVMVSSEIDINDSTTKWFCEYSSDSSVIHTFNGSTKYYLVPIATYNVPVVSEVYNNSSDRVFSFTDINDVYHELSYSIISNNSYVASSQINAIGITSATLSDDSITIVVDGTSLTYSLSEVRTVPSDIWSGPSYNYHEIYYATAGPSFTKHIYEITGGISEYTYGTITYTNTYTETQALTSGRYAKFITSDIDNMYLMIQTSTGVQVTDYIDTFVKLSANVFQCSVNESVYNSVKAFYSFTYTQSDNGDYYKTPSTYRVNGEAIEFTMSDNAKTYLESISTSVTSLTVAFDGEYNYFTNSIVNTAIGKFVMTDIEGNSYDYSCTLVMPTTTEIYNEITKCTLNVSVDKYNYLLPSSLNGLQLSVGSTDTKITTEFYEYYSDKPTSSISGDTSYNAASYINVDFFAKYTSTKACYDNVMYILSIGKLHYTSQEFATDLTTTAAASVTSTKTSFTGSSGEVLGYYRRYRNGNFVQLNTVNNVEITNNVISDKTLFTNVNNSIDTSATYTLQNIAVGYIENERAIGESTGRQLERSSYGMSVDKSVVTSLMEVFKDGVAVGLGFNSHYRYLFDDYYTKNIITNTPYTSTDNVDYTNVWYDAGDLDEVNTISAINTDNILATSSANEYIYNLDIAGYFNLAQKYTLTGFRTWNSSTGYFTVISDVDDVNDLPSTLRRFQYSVYEKQMTNRKDIYTTNLTCYSRSIFDDDYLFGLTSENVCTMDVIKHNPDIFPTTISTDVLANLTDENAPWVNKGFRIAASPNLSAEIPNVYGMNIFDYEEGVTNDYTKCTFEYNGNKFRLVSVSTDGSEGQPIFYSFMDSLCASSGTATDGIMDVECGSGTVETLIDDSNATESTVTKSEPTTNLDLLYDTYFETIRSNYSIGADNVSTIEMYGEPTQGLSFKFDCIPVTSEPVKSLTQDFLEVSRDPNFATDSTTLKMTNVIKYDKGSLTLTTDNYKLNSYNKNSEIVDDYYYNFTTDDDLWKRLGFLPCTIEYNKDNLINYNQATTIDVPADDTSVNPTYLIKGKYYSEQLYTGAITTPHKYRLTTNTNVDVNGSTKTVQSIYNIASGVDIKSIDDSIMSTYFLKSSHFAERMMNLSVPTRIEVRITQNEDVEKVVNETDLMSTNSVSLGAYPVVRANDPAYANIQQSFDINKTITIPNNGAIYVYLTSPNQRYPIINSECTLSVEYIK